ncbi:MAG: hypothetical protein OK456_08110 [Thaumarchaeota archaeon]|nr:hypothetical protein [Nitrososphaerota archaeon]
MSLIRKAAASVSLLNGLWGILLGLFGATPLAGTLHLNGATLVVAAILVLASILCFTWLPGTFYLSALLSVLMLVFIPGGIQLADLFLFSLALAAATIVSDAMAANSKEYVPEKDHPMNLPVFG